MFVRNLVYVLVLCDFICNVMASSKPVLATVEQGTLQGEVLNRSTGNGTYYSFKGIPYAAPPVGELRFKSPKDPIPWKGIRNATKHGAVCPQINIDTLVYTPGSEDCLFLNVYTPNIRPKKPLAVMMYIHGGVLIAGSGNSDQYGPDFLLDQNVVVVTINFREGALGFLCLDIEEAPGNAGLKDQAAALKWINKNIANFGGDPNNVTIFGQSSGGIAISLHLLSPLSNKYFKRAIAMSGTYQRQFSFEPVKRALKLSQKLGFYTDDRKAAFKFLQNASVESIVTTNVEILFSDAFRGISIKFKPFSPVVEKDFGGCHFLTEDPDKILSGGKKINIDLMLGWTALEGIQRTIPQKKLIFNSYPYYGELLVPTKILHLRSPETDLNLAEKIHKKYFGDEEISEKNIDKFFVFFTYLYYKTDIFRFLEKWTKNGNKAYLYSFNAFTDINYFGKQGIEYGVRNATHTDDTFYVFYRKAFNVTYSFGKSSKSYAVIKNTTKLYADFARYGNPTPDNSLGVKWLDYSQNNSIFYIDKELSLHKFDTTQNMDFWRGIYESVGLSFS